MAENASEPSLSPAETEVVPMDFANNEGEPSPTRRFQTPRWRFRDIVTDNGEKKILCIRCSGVFDAVSVNYVRHRSRPGYICRNCYHPTFRDVVIGDFYFGTNSLPETDLSRCLEQAVSIFIPAGSNPLFVREIGARKRCHELEGYQHAKNFLTSIGVPTSFPFTSRAFLIFQKVRGGEVAFFYAQTQEYSEDCPHPNKQSINLSIIDSAQVSDIKDSKARSKVFHAFILAYIAYMAKFGFTRLCIWSCAPNKKETEYVFQWRPKRQKLITNRRLINWYNDMINFGKQCGFIASSETLFACMQNTTADTFFHKFPFYKDDYWPELLNSIVEEANQPPTEASEDGGGIYRKDVILKKFRTELNRLKSSFICVTIKSPDIQVLGETVEMPPLTVFEDRDKLVEFFRENSLEYSDVVKARYATQRLVVELIKQLEQPPEVIEID